MFFRQTFLLIVAVWTVVYSQAQQPAAKQDSLQFAQPLPEKYLSTVSAKADQLGQTLDKKSQKALERWQRQEARIRKKLANIDSLKASQVFGNAQEKYQQLEQKLQNTDKLKQYIPSLDTLTTSLKFLQKNPQLLSKTKGAEQKLTSTLKSVSGLGTQFQKAEEIKKFLKERKQYLKDQLAGLNFGKELKQLNKQAFYYGQQLAEYKAVLKDHKKAEKKALELLSKTKLFKDFMRKNSQLAGLFRIPGDPNDPAAQASIAGLQTRAQVNSMIQQRITAGGAGARQQFQQNLQQAQDQLHQLKDKVSKFGSGSTDDIMPEGFKPNGQKTRSFMDRLELGTNIQSQRARGYWPVTSDIGLSLGYKLNDKSILGLGMSYKLGLGKDIRHISFSHQGLGFRSFADWKIKGSWWLSGGYEMNYRSQFSSIAALQNRSGWQQSGLVGMSKVISLRTKFFKKTKAQLLWDFMSYQQVPRAQPVVFRIGYTF